MPLKPWLPDTIADSAALGCTAIQIFSKSPRMWRSTPLEGRGLAEFREAREKAGIGPLAVHASYLLNLATPEPVLRQKSVEALADELRRAESLDAEYLVLHVGSTQDPDRAAIPGRVARAAATAFRLSNARRTTLLFENLAGGPGDFGATMESLQALLERCSGPGRYGVCLDTCHLFQSGYDVSKADGVRSTWELAEKRLGAGTVRFIHLNDAKKPLGAGLDRHENIGKGHIGEAGFRALLKHPGFRGLPLVLETPKDPMPQADLDNLAAVRRLASLR